MDFATGRSAGYLADRFDPAHVVLVGLVVSATAIVLVPFATGASLVSIAVLGGAGIGTVWTNTDTVISSLAKEGRLVATLGAAGSFKELGDMLGPLLIGFVSQSFGLKVGFVACGVLGFGTIAVLRLWPWTSLAAHHEQLCTDHVQGKAHNDKQ